MAYEEELASAKEENRDIDMEGGPDETGLDAFFRDDEIWSFEKKCLEKIRTLRLLNDEKVYFLNKSIKAALKATFLANLFFFIFFWLGLHDPFALMFAFMMIVQIIFAIRSSCALNFNPNMERYIQMMKNKGFVVDALK